MPGTTSGSPPVAAFNTTVMVFDSSCPRLSRASTFQISSQIKDLVGRDKPGHDGEHRS